MTYTHCDCDCKYFYRIGQDPNGKFAFEVGFRTEDDGIETLCCSGEFDTPKEADIAASAFINGLNFFREVSQ